MKTDLPDNSSVSRTTRRSALRTLGAVSFFPWAGALTACATSPDGKLAPGHLAGASPVGVEYTSMPAPATPAAMATTTVGSVMTVRYGDGRSAAFDLAYEPLFTTGDRVPDGLGGTILAGGYFDAKQQPILDRSVPDQTRQFFSDCPDGSTLLTLPESRVPGVQGQPVFMVVQFEYTTRNQAQAPMYGMLPSQIAVLTLDQDVQTGKLRLVQYRNVDTSGVQGLWITCGASLSPWGTHLSSEEYEPDAFAANNPQLDNFSLNHFGAQGVAKAYHYGHLPEVTVQADGSGTLRKHYCMGRISHELVQVMPDRRTVLMGDDATNAGYFAFVADRENDLSSGTLYVARLAAVLTTLDPQAPPVGLQWIRLGHASSDAIRALADRLKPTDILEVLATDPGPSGADRYRRIQANGKTEWIRVLPGMELAAAFLETHRYAAYVGASMAFSKMEGTTVNARDRVAYSAISYARDSMVAGNGKNSTASGVALPRALNAGAVMKLALQAGLNDSSGQPIPSAWMPGTIGTLLAGLDLETPDPLGNTAHADRIANPDNLKFSESLRTLFIGEDSGMHVNNFLWAYNVDSGRLSRILSTPAGAESTGLHAADDVHGWTYVLSNFQHAGDWEKGLHDRVKGALDPLVRAKYKDRFGADVGYLTARPRMQG